MLTLINDKRWIQNAVLEACKASKVDRISVVDETVENEKELVEQIPENDDSLALLVKNVTKQYSSQGFAVDGVSFHVEKGNCFGLLGSNGAGKTTTLKMLIGRGQERHGCFLDIILSILKLVRNNPFPSRRTVTVFGKIIDLRRKCERFIRQDHWLLSSK
jgi:ABC-type glutathione transport system ATPase component